MGLQIVNLVQLLGVQNKFHNNKIFLPIFALELSSRMSSNSATNHLNRVCSSCSFYSIHKKDLFLAGSRITLASVKVLLLILGDLLVLLLPGRLLLLLLLLFSDVGGGVTSRDAKKSSLVVTS